MRSGLPLDAIDVYLKILTNFPVIDMIYSFKKLVKDKPSFLNYEDQEGETSIRVPETFVDFDSILGQACKICKRDDLDCDQRMGAWFKILRYLQNFMVESFSKVSDAFKQEHKNPKLVVIKEEEQKPYYI